MDYKWPLSISPFTFTDRLKICKFFLNPKNRWTQGEYVRKYEKAWEYYTKAEYVLMTSSGSTANTLLAQYQKDHSSSKKIVLFPSVTWSTSVNPWIREGFQPIFLDVSLSDLSIDINKLESYLKENSSNVNCVFVTSLLGFTPDVNRLIELCNKYKTTLKLDNCENSFGGFERPNQAKWQHICSVVTSTTSNYFSHQITTGMEGGLIFTNDRDEYIYYLMARNHGMTRHLYEYGLIAEHQKTKKEGIDPRFDFHLVGNNFRNTNIAAFIGLLDFKRLEDYIKRRKFLYEIFQEKLDEELFILPEDFYNREHVPFSLPIIINPTYRRDKKFAFERIKSILESEGIEYRPLISGSLLHHKSYLQYGYYMDFPVAEHLHRFALYVGLYPDLREKQVCNLVEKLNFVKYE